MDGGLTPRAREAGICSRARGRETMTVPSPGGEDLLPSTRFGKRGPTTLDTINERSPNHYIDIFLADIRTNDVGAAPAAARKIRSEESSAARRLVAAALELYLGSRTSDEKSQSDKPQPDTSQTDTSQTDKLQLDRSQPDKSQPEAELHAGLETLAEVLAGLETLAEVLAREVRPENGKPYLPDYPDFHYNISHSGGIVACAASDSPVGIDIQQISDDPVRILKIAAHFFSQEEQQELNFRHQEKNPNTGAASNSCSNDEQDLCHLFCRFWTARESYIKLTGRGLAEPFSGFRPDLAAGRIITASPSVDNYYLTECPAPEGYCMTVCSTEPIDVSCVTIHT